MELILEHLASHLPYGLKYKLPLESERFDSILENEPFRLALPFMSDEGKLIHLGKYEKMYLYQKNPQIMVDNNELFLGQMESSLGFEEDDVYLSEVKPLLHPLSSFEQFEEITDEMSQSDIDYLKHSLEFGAEPINGFCKSLSYSIIKAMLKNHIDIHSLIPKGLAVDINTINVTK